MKLGNIEGNRGEVQRFSVEPVTPKGWIAVVSKQLDFPVIVRDAVVSVHPGKADFDYDALGGEKPDLEKLFPDQPYTDHNFNTTDGMYVELESPGWDHSVTLQPPAQLFEVAMLGVNTPSQA